MNHTVKIIVGDITKHSSDVIVNSANNRLMHGCGVCGAIHKAAGPELEKECLRIKQQKNIVFLPIGDVAVSSAYLLPHKYVFHTVSPRMGKNVELLANCYINSLKEADKLKAKSISFPAIGTGIYGVPIEKSALIVKKVLDSMNEFNHLKEIFLFFKKESHAKAYSKIFGCNEIIKEAKNENNLSNY